MLYDAIAPVYDKNPIRHAVAPDDHVALLAARGGRVLDLACGTGNFLVAQRERFPESKIELFGLDASDAMLDVARGKALGVELRLGRAEQLPWRDAFFDYVVCRFAFHHFDDKPRALAEMARVLAPTGRIRLENIAPERSTSWILYEYFPEAIEIDRARFWSVDRIAGELATLGFSARTTDVATPTTTRAAFLVEARNRDNSELQLIGDAAWREGLARLERDAHDESRVPLGLVLANVVASRT
jgi:ubiquinone/menaquinone biosynthesis C-methylase UbiE